MVYDVFLGMSNMNRRRDSLAISQKGMFNPKKGGAVGTFFIGPRKIFPAVPAGFGQPSPI